MKFTQTLLSLALASTALASPLLLRTRNASPSLFPRSLEQRDSCAATCGSVCYYQSDIDTAVQNGCQLTQNGNEEGSSDYPHQYNDDEGFNFPVDGPYYEYPILSSYKAYGGGSPGADRVVYNDQCQLAGVITHTGASGDDFVGCSGQDGASTK